MRRKEEKQAERGRRTGSEPAGARGDKREILARIEREAIASRKRETKKRAARRERRFARFVEEHREELRRYYRKKLNEHGGYGALLFRRSEEQAPPSGQEGQQGRQAIDVSYLTLSGARSLCEGQSEKRFFRKKVRPRIRNPEALVYFYPLLLGGHFAAGVAKQ